MNNYFKVRRELKEKFINREKLFGGWVSYAHPSITETFTKARFDFIAIDMEHSTISLSESQRIIAACQAENIPCLPRPVSHSNDWIKPLLEAGADGLFIQMVNNANEVERLIQLFKYPPVGTRSFGVSRAQGYGFDFAEYVQSWNESSSLILQIESIEAVNNIESILSFTEVDGVMIGPYDLSGSLGIPGQLNHSLIIEASEKVIKACKKFGKSCGTQLSHPNEKDVYQAYELGYTYVILGSDLFALWEWSQNMKELINAFSKAVV